MEQFDRDRKIALVEKKKQFLTWLQWNFIITELIFLILLRSEQLRIAQLRGYNLIYWLFNPRQDICWIHKLFIIKLTQQSNSDIFNTLHTSLMTDLNYLTCMVTYIYLQYSIWTSCIHETVAYFIQNRLRQMTEELTCILLTLFVENNACICLFNIQPRMCIFYPKDHLYYRWSQ